MNELKDWRGTPIEIGSRVVTHGLGKFPTRSIGTVVKLHDTGLITVDPKERTKSWGTGKIVISPDSVTVLTKDMFDG